MWGKYMLGSALAENPHTRGCHVVTTVGDVNPIEYGGGYLFLCKVSGQSNYVVEYTHGTENEPAAEGLSEYEPAYSRVPLVLYRVDLPENVWEWHSWADPNDVATSIDADPAELRRAGSSPDPRERLYALEAIAGHWGWNELDHYPLSMTVSDLRKRWYRALRSP